MIPHVEETLLQRMLVKAVELLAKGPRPRLVQIGACDGEQNDPVHNLIRSLRLPSLLIEPLHDNFAMLTASYADCPHVHFLNVAVSTKSAWSTIRYVPRKAIAALGLPLWATGIGTIETGRNAIDNVRVDPDIYEKLKDAVQTQTIPTLDVLTVTAPLAADEQLILIMDTEGHDAALIDRIWSQGLAPKLIYAEYIHMSGTEKERLVLGARAHGYSCCASHENVLLLREGGT